MTLIINDKKGSSTYYDVQIVSVNANREVTLAYDTINKVGISLINYYGCNAVLVVGNRNELVTIGKEKE